MLRALGLPDYVNTRK